MARVLVYLLVVAATLWLAVIVTGPFVLAAGEPLATGGALVYEVGRLICHQRPERSFHLAGIQLSVCARCLGLYGSAAFGGIAVLLFGHHSNRPRSPRLILALAALPTAITVGLEAAGLLRASNLARFCSALPLGATAAWVCIGLLCRDAAQAAPSSRA